MTFFKIHQQSGKNFTTKWKLWMRSVKTISFSNKPNMYPHRLIHSCAHFLPPRAKLRSCQRTMINAAVRWSHLWTGPKRHGVSRKAASINKHKYEKSTNVAGPGKNGPQQPRNHFRLCDEWRRRRTHGLWRDQRPWINNCGPQQRGAGRTRISKATATPWTSSTAVEKAMVGNNLHVRPRHL